MNQLPALAWRAALRNRALLLPAAAVLTVAMALITALVVLVWGVVESGGNVGALAVFLAVSLVGLLAVVLSMFGVVRAGLGRSLATLQLLGARAHHVRLVMAVIGLLTGAAGVALGAVASPVVHAGLVWMMRATGYHGLPTTPADWPVAMAAGGCSTLLLACLSGLVARAARPDADRPRARRWLWVRAAVATATLAGALALGRVPSLSALAGAGALATVGCIVASGPLMLALAALVARLPLSRTGWPLSMAGHSQGTRRATAAVTVGTLAVCLFTGATGVVTGIEDTSRASLASTFRPTALLLTRRDGTPLDPQAAVRACSATTACVGLLWLPDPATDFDRPAVVDPAAGRVLMLVPAMRGSWRPASDASPWSQLLVGHRSADRQWHALVVLDHDAPAPAGDAVTSARDWAATAPTQVVLRGSGASDIGPMLLPLLLLAALFCAATTYTTFAGQGRTLRTLHHAGATQWSRWGWTAVEATTTTVTVFGLAAVLWMLAGQHSAMIATTRHLAVLGTTTPPAPLAVAAPAMVTLLTALGALGASQSRHVTA